MLRVALTLVQAELDLLLRLMLAVEGLVEVVAGVLTAAALSCTPRKRSGLSHALRLQQLLEADDAASMQQAAQHPADKLNS